MKNFPSLRATFLLLLFVAPTGAERAVAQSRLVWTNGDALPGELQSVRGAQLSWRSSLFVQPLKLKLNQLSHLTVEYKTVVASKAPWRITMHNGDVYFGKLQTIEGPVVTIDSKRHGQVLLHRTMVQSILRNNNPALIYQGPNNLLGWNTYDDDSVGRSWAKTARGELATRTKDAQLFRRLPVQNQVAIEVELQAKKQPYFQLALSDRPTQSPRLELWDN